MATISNGESGLSVRNKLNEIIDKVEGNATIDNNLIFGDDNKAIFGDDSDLQIYHDGSNSYIDETGTGTLRIRGYNQVRITDTSDNIAAIFKGDAETTLFHNDSPKLATTSTGIAVTGNATFADNGKAIFGAGSDLQIYHDGSNSIITDQGTGNLKINASSFEVNNFNDTSNILDGNAAGAVKLYHAGSQKLTTTSTGVDITGTLTSDGLTVDGNGSLLTLDNGSNPATLSNTNGNITLDFDTTNAGRSFNIEENGNKAFRINGDGDISFYEDTGTTAKFFWDASAESLGIGTDSPAVPLDIKASSSSVRVESSGAGNTAALALQTLASGGTGNGYGALIGGNEASSGTASYLGIHTRDSAGTIAERMRIDSSGNTTFKANNISHGPIVTLENTASAVNGQAWGSIHFKSNDVSTNASGTRASIVATSTSFNGDGNLVFTTAPSNGSNIEAMRIDSSGRVGIGTGSPDAALVVEESAVSQTAQGNDFAVFKRNADGYLKIYSGNTNVGGIAFGDPDDPFIGAIRYQHSTDHLDFYVNNAERMRIDSSGRVGIGTSSPSANLTVTDGTAAGTLSIGDNAAGSTSVRYLQFGESNDYSIQSNANSYLRFYAEGDEAMRIDSSGNLLVGHTDRNTIVSDGTSGALLGYDGFIGASRLGSLGEVMVLNREDSDGGILTFRKDGTTVGSIGSYLGAYLVAGSSGNSNDTYLAFANGTIKPATSTGESRDNTTNLGQSNARFKDLYLSGGVYLGGTGSANKLDDYEEGTWTPDFGGTRALASGTNYFYYVKIGRQVTVNFQVINATWTGSTTSNIMTGLPFTVDRRSVGSVVYRQINLDNSTIQMPVCVEQSSTNLFFPQLKDDANWVTLGMPEITNADYLHFTVTYFTDS